MERMARTTGILFREVVTGRLKSAVSPDVDGLTRLRSVFITLQKADPYMRRGWIEDLKGKILVQGFSGPVPTKKMRHLATIGKMNIYSGKDESGYVVNMVEIPITLNDGSKIIFKAYVRSIYRLQRQDILFVMVLLGLAVTIGPLLLFVSRLVTRPLKIFSTFTDRVLQGDLSARLVLNSNDELAGLADVFNDMLNMVERMIRGTRELAANISHELRTPLTRVLISRELLEEHLNNFRKEMFAKHLKYIQQDVERMNGMISRILLLSRLEISPVMSAPEEINLQELVEELRESFSAVLDSGKFCFEGRFTGDRHSFGVVDGQRDDLRTALANLMENAVKYTPSGGKISSFYHNGPEEVKITISNSIEPGSLIPGEKLELFEPFFRSNTGQEVHGSGLGLAITAKIIRALDGDISARVEGDIFTVSVIIPVRQGK